MVHQRIHTIERVSTDKENREVTFIISTDAKDRHRTVLNQDGWHLDNFNRNPVVGYQHNLHGSFLFDPNPDMVLGPGRAWTEKIDGKTVLMGAVRFEPQEINPLAEKIYQKIQFGSLRATSVGFMEVGEGRYVKETDAYYFAGQELYEFSIVNIPSNPEAVKRALMQADIIQALTKVSELPEDKIEKMTLGELLQGMRSDWRKEAIQQAEGADNRDWKMELIELSLKLKQRG